MSSGSRLTLLFNGFAPHACATNSTFRIRNVTRLQVSTEVLNSSSRIALDIPANVSTPSKSLKIALAKGNPHENRQTGFL